MQVLYDALGLAPSYQLLSIASTVNGAQEWG